MSASLDYGDASHMPDIQVLDADGKTMFIDAPDRAGLVHVAMVEEAARQEDARYKLLSTKRSMMASGYATQRTF